MKSNGNLSLSFVFKIKKILSGYLKEPLFSGREMIFGHDLMNIVYYCNLINQLFGELFTHCGKETDKGIREWKQNWKPGLSGDLYYTLHSCPFF